jgi:hypothetical protein
MITDLLLVRWQVLLKLLSRWIINNPLVPVPLNIVCRLNLNIIFWREVKVPSRSGQRLAQTKEREWELLAIFRDHRNWVFILGLTPRKFCWMISHCTVQESPRKPLASEKTMNWGTSSRDVTRTLSIVLFTLCMSSSHKINLPNEPIAACKYSEER